MSGDIGDDYKIAARTLRNHEIWTLQGFERLTGTRLPEFAEGVELETEGGNFLLKYFAINFISIIFAVYSLNELGIMKYAELERRLKKAGC